MTRSSTAAPGVTAGPDALAPYRAALDQTARIIQQRARYFRNLVVTVVVIGTLSAVWSLGTRSLTGLVGLLLLVPACIVFFLGDARLLNSWRAELLAAWVRRELGLAAFSQALAANPAVPKPTVEAMIATLPAAGDVVAEQRIGASTRQAAAAVSRSTNVAHAHVLRLDATVSALVALAVVGAIAARTRWPLLALVVLVVRPLLAGSIRRRHSAAAKAEVEMCRRQPGFDEATFARVITTLGKQDELNQYTA
jgi:hypothetical protein